jgi:hypothetical protein
VLCPSLKTARVGITHLKRGAPVAAILLATAIVVVALATAPITTASVPESGGQMKPAPSHTEQLRCPPQVSIGGPVTARPSEPARVKIDMLTLPIARPNREQHEAPIGQLDPAQQAPEPRPTPLCP